MNDHANSSPPDASRVSLIVPGMGSDHCAGLVSASIRRLDGIRSIETRIAGHRVEVDFDPAATGPEAIRSAVERAGYDVDEVLTHTRDATTQEAESEERYLAQAWKRLWIAAVPTTLIMLLMVPHMFWQPVPGYLAIVALLAFPVV